MSALGNTLLIGAIWLAYTFLFFGLTVQTDPGKDGKDPAEQVEEMTEAPAVNIFPIGFRWSVDTAFITDQFKDLKKSVLSEKGENNHLEITGLYFDAEENPTEAATMGFARAERVKALFAGDIPADRIHLRAQVMDDKPGVRSGYFEAIRFAWTQPEETVEETVEELEDRIIIRFPFASATKEYDPKVDQYLRKLAGRIQETGETVSLTGHTDNKSSEEFNYELGLERAQGIRDVLVRLGVPADQISVDSKGETRPVDSNDTEEGRHNNRRVEVRLNKQ